MAQVTASTSAPVPATPEATLAALADYAVVRPAILPEQYTDYAVTEGGTGTGTVATWRLHATEKRVRHVVAEVRVDDGDTVIEDDRNSSMVTVFTVRPAGTGSTVEVTTSWEGAGGIGGFFERTFAPKGLNRIHDALLGNLARHLAG
ncbi:MAG TPA: SRPBCC family protein [Nocardioides sp.]|nr:SRPBCC family protein [Nocardioides sp.]